MIKDSSLGQELGLSMSQQGLELIPFGFLANVKCLQIAKHWNTFLSHYIDYDETVRVMYVGVA